MMTKSQISDLVLFLKNNKFSDDGFYNNFFTNVIPRLSLSQKFKLLDFLDDEIRNLNSVVKHINSDISITNDPSLLSCVDTVGVNINSNSSVDYSYSNVEDNMTFKYDNPQLSKQYRDNLEKCFVSLQCHLIGHSRPKRRVKLKTEG